MVMNHPLGIGAGNFPWVIGRYDPSLYARDAHNTFVRTAAELGVHCLALHLLLLASAGYTLRRARLLAKGTSQDLEIHYHAYAILVANVVMFTCGMFMSQTFIEEYWWFLSLPVCLYRCAERARQAGHVQLEALPAPDYVYERYGRPSRSLQPA
jgi:hypothetical protein